MVCLLWPQTGFPICLTTAWASPGGCWLWRVTEKQQGKHLGPGKFILFTSLNSGLSAKKGTIENVNKYWAKKTHGYSPLPNHSYFNIWHSKQECHFQFNPFLDSPLHLFSRVAFPPSTNCVYKPCVIPVHSICGFHFHTEWEKWLMQENLLPPEDSGRNIHLDLIGG